MIVKPFGYGMFSIYAENDAEKIWLKEMMKDAPEYGFDQYAEVTKDEDIGPTEITISSTGL